MATPLRFKLVELIGLGSRINSLLFSYKSCKNIKTWISTNLPISLLHDRRFVSVYSSYSGDQLTSMARIFHFQHPY